MTAKDFLKQAQAKLKATNVPTARLDALILLEDVSVKDRAWLLAHPEFKLSGEQLKLLQKQIDRRAKHEPLAYIRGRSAFYGRDFFVTPDTLQPRPETETMIELIKEIHSKDVRGPSSHIIDVGTGSGCIAITSKLELPKSKVIATDISAPCLEVAKRSAEHLKADIVLLQTNLVSDINPDQLDDATLCCNLPYVPSSFTINQAAMFEPEIAIFGGKDGLDYYRQLFDQLQEKKAKPGSILTESLPTQHAALKELAKTYSYKLQKTQDFIQVFRFFV